MKLTRALLYLVLVALAFVVANVVVSALFSALALIWTLVTTAATLLVLGAVGYGVYRLYTMLSGKNSSPSPSSSAGTFDSGASTDIEPEGRVESIQKRYADGKLTEAEMEKLLERELDDREYDGVDREFQGDRTS